MKFAAGLVLCVSTCFADVGDPQLATDHPYYPGELACSTFERLFETQAGLYERLTGKRPETDEEKALAAWAWRNTHYAHGEEGASDVWGAGFNKGGDGRNREYWTGLFSHGFGLCGTTHSQWTAEFEHLLGHARARGVGVRGHNSFEVFLKGGAYGEGRWALLDHDVSTIVLDPKTKRLLSIAEIKDEAKKRTDRKAQWAHQQGWPVCGLHPDDGSAFQEYTTAEYLPGYAGPPPMVHLRRGEKFRRCFEPGLEDGKTFVFWGRNDKTEGIPGPERSLTWVNQPERFRGSAEGVKYKAGQARFANAVFTYEPNFADGSYREGVLDESDNHVTFEFRSPYVIGATPANDSEWGIYDAGAKNGVIVRGVSDVAVVISLNHGRTWQEAGVLKGEMDLTDLLKGRTEYWIRFGAGAEKLKGLSLRTVCQANAAVFPRLRDEGTKVRFEAGAQSVVSERATQTIKTPRGEPIRALYAAAHVASGNPPDSNILYQIEFSLDAGKTWEPMVKDWRIERRGEEPPDFWSQSMCYGSMELPGESKATRAQVRFRNNGGRQYLRTELHAVYKTPSRGVTRVTYAWSDSKGEQKSSYLVRGAKDEWTIPTASAVKTKWVEMSSE